MFHGSSRNWHHHHSTRWHLSIISEVFPLFIETLRSDPWQFSLLNHEEYRHRVIPLYRLFFLWIYMDISHLIPIGIIPNKWCWTYPPSILLDSGHSRNPAPAILDETCWNPKNHEKPINCRISLAPPHISTPLCSFSRRPGMCGARQPCAEMPLAPGQMPVKFGTFLAF